MLHIIFLDSWFKCLPTFCIWNFDSYTSSTSWVSIAGNFSVYQPACAYPSTVKDHPLHSLPQRVTGPAHSCIFMSVRSDIKRRHAVQQVQASTCIRKVMKKWKWNNLFKHLGRQLLVWRQVIKSDPVSSDANMCSWPIWTESCSLSGGDVKQATFVHYLDWGTCLGRYACIICYMLLVREFITSSVPVCSTSGI